MAFSFNFLVWNSCGVSTQEFMDNFHDLVGEHHLVLVVILDMSRTCKESRPILE